jgi:hypothetical protein
MIHGYSASTGGALVLNTAILMVGSTYWGVSRGAPSFDPGREIRQAEFDGQVQPIVGNDRIVGYKSQISFTGLEAKNADLTRLELNQAVAAAVAGVQVLTPLPAQQLFVKASGQYVADVRMIGERGDGKLYSVHFPYAVVLSYSVKSNDKGEAEFSITVEARLDPTGTPLNIGVAPYRIEVRDAVP